MERFSKNLPLERMHAAREDGTIVGGAGAFPFELTVPGGARADGGRHGRRRRYPTHRRRGVLRAMMRAQLDDVHEREEPVALLWASEETIYGRFGYGMASLAGEIELAREYSAFARPFAPEGRVRFVEADEAAQLFPRVWNAVAAPHAGHALALEKLVGVPDPLRRARAGGRAQALRRARAGRPPRGLRRLPPQAEVGERRLELASSRCVEAVALDGRPTAEIWRYLFDIDWAARIGAFLLPVDHPLFFLLANPRRLRFRFVRRSLGAARRRRRRALGARLCGRRRGRVRRGRRLLPVERGPLAARRRRRRSGRRRRRSCAATSPRSARPTSAAFGFSELAARGRVEELRRGAAARADAMFASERAPWCPEIF